MEGKDVQVVVDGDRFRVVESADAKRWVYVYDGDALHEQSLGRNGEVIQQESEVMPSKGPGLRRFWSALWIDEIFNTKEIGPGETVLGRETIKYQACTGILGSSICVTDHVDTKLKIALKREGQIPFECTKLVPGEADESAFARPW